jgi:hypothetical protein
MYFCVNKQKLEWQEYAVVRTDRGLTTKRAWVRTPSIYWIDVSNGRYFIERNITIKVAKQNTPKTKFKK